MTCIVGIAENGKVTMGADSAGAAGYEIATRKDSKVFINGGVLMGCTTSFRMIQLLQYALTVPKRHPDTDVMRYMVTEFIPAVRVCFRDGGFMTKASEADVGGNFLVGIEGRLFNVYSDFQVGERAEGFDACGCGEAYALAAMLCTADAMPADQRVRRALEVAERFSAGVRGPFNLLHI